MTHIATVIAFQQEQQQLQTRQQVTLVSDVQSVYKNKLNSLLKRK